MTLRDKMLPLAERLRTRADHWGMRQFDVVLRVITWTGDRPGRGTREAVDTPLTLSTGARPKVTMLRSKDIIASGGKYADGDYRIGPFTPAFDGGGRAPSFLEPAVNERPAEILFRLTGPGMEEGVWFQKIDTDVDRNCSYFITIRRTNVTNP